MAPVSSLAAILTGEKAPALSKKVPDISLTNGDFAGKKRSGSAEQQGAGSPQGGGSALGRFPGCGTDQGAQAPGPAPSSPKSLCGSSEPNECPLSSTGLLPTQTQRLRKKVNKNLLTNSTVCEEA